MVEKVLIKKLIEEKLEIVQPACLPTVRQAGRQVRKGRFYGWAEGGGSNAHYQLQNAAFCTTTRQYSPEFPHLGS
jgi:hypothetical protein